ARSLIFATGLPPATVAAAAAALKIIAEDRELVIKPVHNARLFATSVGREQAQSAIVPVIVGESERALKAASMLEAHGYLVAPIRPPTVPIGTARLRFAFTAMHHPEDITRVAALLKTHGYL